MLLCGSFYPVRACVNYTMLFQRSLCQRDQWCKQGSMCESVSMYVAGQASEARDGQQREQTSTNNNRSTNQCHPLRTYHLAIYTTTSLSGILSTDVCLKYVKI